MISIRMINSAASRTYVWIDCIDEIRVYCHGDKALVNEVLVKKVLPLALFTMTAKTQIPGSPKSIVSCLHRWYIDKLILSYLPKLPVL